MKRLLSCVALGFALVLGSCKDGPTAGDLSVDLVTPNTDDGAIQFTATAAGVDDAAITGVTSACSGCKLFLVKVSDTQYKGVVTGNIGAGPLVRIGVSDVKKPLNYSVSITAVSSRTFILRAASQYSVTIK